MFYSVQNKKSTLLPDRPKDTRRRRRRKKKISGMTEQKVANGLEISLLIEQARSIFGRLGQLVGPVQASQLPLSMSDAFNQKQQREHANELELDSIFGTGGGSLVRSENTSTESIGPFSSLSAEEESRDAMDTELMDALNEARQSPAPVVAVNGPHVEIHPVYPNTFKVQRAQLARHQVNAEAAITRSLSTPSHTSNGQRVKTPLNPALMAAKKAGTYRKDGRKHDWAKGGGGGGGKKRSSRPYDAEHAERMRIKAVSGAKKKRRHIAGSGSGGGGGGMSMVDPAERLAEAREDAQSNRGGGGGGSSGGVSSGDRGYVGRWKGI